MYYTGSTTMYYVVLYGVYCDVLYSISSMLYNTIVYNAIIHFTILHTCLFTKVPHIPYGLPLPVRARAAVLQGPRVSPRIPDILPQTPYESLRAVRLLRVWISEGLTQADS